MKKKILIALPLVLAAGILIFVVTKPTDEERARQNLLSKIIESIDENSNDSDYLTEHNYEFIIRNSSTRDFLLEVLKTARAEETTGCAAKPSAPPSYCVSGECIGGEFSLDSSYNNRYFSFHIEGINQYYLKIYIAALEQARELFGIECNNTPSYLHFIKK